MKTIAQLIVILTLLGTYSSAKDPPAKEPERYKIVTRRSDDVVKVSKEKDKVIFAITSPFGISQAVIERKDATWPKEIVVKFHLKGLEKLSIASGKTTLHAAVSAQEGKPKARVWKNDQEDAPLDMKSPLWMEVRILGADGKPAQTLPLKEGYFEMTLPAALLTENPSSLSLSWIDFYRN